MLANCGLHYSIEIGKLPPCTVHCSAKYGTLDFLVSCRIQNIGILYATQYGLYFRRKSYWRRKKWLSCFQIDMWYDTKCKTKYDYLMWKWHKMRILLCRVDCQQILSGSAHIWLQIQKLWLYLSCLTFLGQVSLEHHRHLWF